VDLHILVTFAANWELMVSLASLVIAICAICVSVWQGIQTRKHNQISVTPHLTTWVETEAKKNKYTIELMNNGIGPAVIDSFSLCVDGKEIKSESSKKIGLALKILFPNNDYKEYHSWFGNKYVMAKDEKRSLLDIIFLGPNAPSSEKVLKNIERSSLKIIYRSMYDKFFVLETKGMKTITSGQL